MPENTYRVTTAVYLKNGDCDELTQERPAETIKRAWIQCLAIHMRIANAVCGHVMTAETVGHFRGLRERLA